MTSGGANRRTSFRCGTSLERRECKVRVSRKSYDALMLDESRGGFGIFVADVVGMPPIETDDRLEVLSGGSLFQVRVANLRCVCDKSGVKSGTRLGLERLDTGVPKGSAKQDLAQSVKKLGRRTQDIRSRGPLATMLNFAVIGFLLCGVVLVVSHFIWPLYGDAILRRLRPRPNLATHRDIPSQRSIPTAPPAEPIGEIASNPVVIEATLVPESNAAAAVGTLSPTQRETLREMLGILGEQWRSLSPKPSGE